MIFVAVGTQMHFDRLVAAVDEWAGSINNEEVFAQVGPSLYQASNIQTRPFITPEEFRKYVEQARFIVSHAGMGTILTALELGKRVAVMPRRSDLGEHRNDHQLATAKYFGDQGRVVVTHDRTELFEKLAQWSDAEMVEPVSATASPLLIATIRRFIESRNTYFALQPSAAQATR